MKTASNLYAAIADVTSAQPDRDLLIQPNGKLAYGEALDRCAQIQALLEQCGVNRGDRIVAQVDKSIEAVWIATPDHWHSPAAILAVEAGKHVYVEKPVSHNIREGRLLLEEIVGTPSAIHSYMFVQANFDQRFQNFLRTLGRSGLRAEHDHIRELRRGNVDVL